MASYAVAKMRYALVLICLLSATAYAKKYALTPAAIVPAATGEVNTGTDKNGNTELKVKVRHLARPESLTPARQTYVVWIQQTGGTFDRAGILRVNKNLEGSFETTTPHKAFDLLITAEDDQTLSAPSGPEVLRTSVRP